MASCDLWPRITGDHAPPRLPRTLLTTKCAVKTTDEPSRMATFKLGIPCHDIGDCQSGDFKLRQYP